MGRGSDKQRVAESRASDEQASSEVAYARRGLRDYTAYITARSASLEVDGCGVQNLIALAINGSLS